MKKLRPSDEIAVEVTGNTRLFRDAVAPHVARVVAVDPNQFKVISHSVKKTDPNDARNLALYLEKDLLPEVRMKDKTQAQLASLTQTRDTLVKLRTALMPRTKRKVARVAAPHPARGMPPGLRPAFPSAPGSRTVLAAKGALRRAQCARP